MVSKRRKHLVLTAILVFVVGLSVLSARFVDYGILWYMIKGELTGHPADTCLDLPEEYWRRIPKCNPVLQEIEDLQRQLDELDRDPKIESSEPGTHPR